MQNEPIGVDWSAQRGKILTSHENSNLPLQKAVIKQYFEGLYVMEDIIIFQKGSRY